MEWLTMKGYEIQKASEEGKNIVFVPYKEYADVAKKLKRTKVPYALRFACDYEWAVFTI